MTGHPMTPHFYALFLSIFFVCSHAQTPFVYAFGQNAQGQLGLGNTNITSTAYPLKIPFLSNTKSITTAIDGGSTWTLSLADTGEHYSWGTGVSGSLGLASVTFTNQPVQISNVLAGLPIKGISAGRGHSVAWTTDGRLYVWGINDFGQLGLNDSYPFGSSIPVLHTFFEIPNQPGIEIPIATASAGSQHTLVVDNIGATYSFGGNSNGQLGTLLRVDSRIPVRVAGPLYTLPVVGVAAGTAHSLAWTLYGQLYFWGKRHDALPDSLLPYIVDLSLEDDPPGYQNFVVAAAAGMSGNVGHSFALTSAGRLFGWGYNSEGQLGTGDKKTRPNPTLITTSDYVVFDNVDAVSSGVGHTLIRTTDGEIYATGDNDYGQLGLGYYSDSEVWFTPIAKQANTQITPQIGTGFTFSFFTDAIPYFIPPTLAPVIPTLPPTISPAPVNITPSLPLTNSPSTPPTNFPSPPPTNFPSPLPTNFPSLPLTNSPTLSPTEFPTAMPTAYPTVAPTVENITFPVIVVTGAADDDDILLLIAAIAFLAALLCCLLLLGLAFRRRRKRKGEIIEPEVAIDMESPLLRGIGVISFSTSDSTTEPPYQPVSAPYIYPALPPVAPGKLALTSSTESTKVFFSSESEPSYGTNSDLQLPSTEIFSSEGDSEQINLPYAPSRSNDTPSAKSVELPPEPAEPVFDGRSKESSTPASPVTPPSEKELLFPGGGSAPDSTNSSVAFTGSSSSELVFPGGKPDVEPEDEENPKSSSDEEKVFTWFQ
eukprot:TRINITY_DN6713_c0_g1_i1.p1 TRINITY_DN6713_c0_g1~~TRINITY_DN6713_c0_g1_i1.p1  ORF type:complete len:764 (+),score=170.03 TRINITY_DN6713_c0_g1_i1:48-2339(+)